MALLKDTQSGVVVRLGLVSWSLFGSSAACWVTFFFSLSRRDDGETSRKRGMTESLFCRRHADKKMQNAASSLVRILALDKNGLEKRSLTDERGSWGGEKGGSV
ncbi:hypothetical protein BDP55DRAFT_137363 [Colletotrichum godetiae]|uniref:Uncharacterized protein n=1 Tax=Colletotrichum godetiae TaxID=1209918 RepID=A0AAJ0AZC1_9PEZI|nr:uncharacterized protein BDP55DRAFT_137363 [Colletotrichum godetiae]KAK1700601.1 hypothetical protein BDP55DRAFT_137363 [Colletotrichum godetiae]